MSSYYVFIMSEIDTNVYAYFVESSVTFAKWKIIFYIGCSTEITFYFILKFMINLCKEHDESL